MGSKAEWRVSNEAWLNKSAKITLKILRAIRKQEISQKELAEKLNVSPQQVSKILKGDENLTLETITQIENVLDISLIEIPESQTADQYKILMSFSIRSKKIEGAVLLIPKVPAPFPCTVFRSEKSTNR